MSRPCSTTLALLGLGLLLAATCAQMATGQFADPRIVVGPPEIDTNGNKLNDLLEVKIATNTLIGPGPAADIRLADGLIVKGADSDRRPFADLIVCLDHPPAPADFAFIRDLGGTVVESWEGVILAMHVTLPPEVMTAGLAAISANRGVTWVDPNLRSDVNLFYSTQQTRARECWNRGTDPVDGDSSIRIAVIDSGLDGIEFGASGSEAHPDFDGKIAAWTDQSGGGWGDAGDRNGHGSHCGGIIAGTGTAAGIATGNGLLRRTYSQYFPTPAYTYYTGAGSKMPVNTTGLTGGTNSLYRGYYHTATGSSQVYYRVLMDSADNIITPGVPTSTVSGSANGFYYSATPDTSSSIAQNTYDFLYQGLLVKDFDSGTYTDYWHVIQQGCRQVAIGDGDNLNAGMAPGCDLVGVKTQDDWGTGTDATVINGINWLLSNNNANNIIGANISLGFNGTSVPTVDAAVTSLINDGTVVCCAAGNERSTARIGSPATAARCIAVVAISEVDKVTNYSSYGASGSSKPDVAAPGGSHSTTRDITSVDTGDSEFVHDPTGGDSPTLWSFTTTDDIWGDDYTGMVGTSMAAPHVAGLVGLVADAMRVSEGTGYWTFGSSTDPLSVKNIILATATETNTTAESTPNPGVTAGQYDRGPKDLVEGYGRINAEAAVSAILDEAPIEELGATGQSTTFGTDARDRKCWAQHCHLQRQYRYGFSMTVPSGCDADLYLYDDNPDTNGDPVIVASSCTATTGGNVESFARDIVTPGDPTVDTYYLVAKLVSGSGTASITGIFIITPVKVSGLRADCSGLRPVLRWETSQPETLAGFNVYSATDPKAGWERRNKALIPAEAKTVTFTLTDLRPGQTLLYRLESVDICGGRTDHGFVQVTRPRW